MSENIVITADWHLDSYPNRTPTKDYRLKQSYRVVDKVLEAVRREGGADTIFILGDLLEKQNRDSIVHSVVKSCLFRLMSGFKVGYYILGNHDINARSLGSESSENDYINSYIPLYCPPNLIYSDKRVVDIGGVSFGFRNYSSADTLDLSFIREYGRDLVDVLCGHSSQSYTDGEPPYPVQSYDESMVKLYSFFGHIHQSVCKGNKVSVGVPQRAKITDDVPRIVLFNTVTKTWKYVEVDPTNELMDFQETTEGESDYFDEVKNTYYIVKKKPTENQELLKAVSETNYDKIFEMEIKERGLGEIFTAVKDATPHELLERLDLDFKLRGIRIKNWRTIKNYSQTFQDGEQFLVSGHNGSGKSSLYSALCYGLSGKCSGLLKDNVRFGESETLVEVDLEYRNSAYTIKRGTSVVELWKDGTLMELGNKPQTREGILRTLPFLEAMDLMYYNEGNQRILGNSSSSDTAKLQILYKILGLNEIDAYNSVASNIHKRLEKELSQKHDFYLVSESSLNEKKNYLGSLEMRYGDVSGFNVDERLGSLRKTLEGYQELYRQKQEYDKKVEENQRIFSDIKATELIISELGQTLGEMRSGEVLQSELRSTQELLSAAQEKLNSILKVQAEISRLSGRKDFIVEEGLRLKKELEMLEEEIHKPSNCPLCGTPLTEEMKREKVRVRKEELERQRGDKLKEYYDLTKTLGELKSEDPGELGKQVNEYQSEVIRLSGEYNEYVRLSSQIRQKQEYLGSLKSRATDSVEKPIDLPGDILTRISDLSSEISILEGYRRLKADYDRALVQFEEIKKDYDSAKVTLEMYSEFITLTKPSGIIYTKIFEIIMSSFSDSRVRYEVNITKRGENRYINISSYLKRTTGDVNYSGASQGEKCMMDIHFLANLKVKFGLLILDEFLGNLDQNNHDDALTKMKSLETNLLFVTSHKTDIITFPKCISVKLENGESKYELT